MPACSRVGYPVASWVGGGYSVHLREVVSLWLSCLSSTKQAVPRGLLFSKGSFMGSGSKGEFLG